MAAKGTLFSKSFRGFDPDEVTAYLEELDRKAKQTLDEKDAQIAAEKAKAETLAQVQKENEALRAEKESLAGKLQTLEEENRDIKQAIAAQGEELEQIKAENGKLKTEREAIEIRCGALEENAKEYEGMLADVNHILSEARRKAEELVEDARHKASEMIDRAKADAKRQSDEIIAQSDEKVNENMKKVRYLYRRKDELAEIFREHKERVDSFFSTLPDKEDKDK